MIGMKFFILLGAAYLLTGCGQSPKATIESNCHRFAKSENADEGEANEVCSCMAENLTENLSKAELKKFAAAFKDAENGEDLERTLQKKGGNELQVLRSAMRCLK